MDFGAHSIRGFEFELLGKVARCSNSQDNILTNGVFSATRSVIGNQFVREMLSIALLF